MTINSETCIVIRCDASRDIGSGHVMRCMSLAEELQRRGARVHFFSSALEGNLLWMIQERGFHVTELHGRSHWNDDARQVESAISALKRPVHWMVVDHYGLGSEWEEQISKRVKHLFVIEDMTNRKHCCHMLLDQNLKQDATTRYRELVPENCELLLGPRYALLSSCFQRVKEKETESNPVSQRVFVFLGGMDSSGETLKVIHALLLLRQVRTISFSAEIVVGAGNPRREMIEAECLKAEGFHFHCQISNMAELMRKSTLFVGAGGSVTWEWCAMGLPGIIMSVADNQEEICREVSARGAARYLGKASDVEKNEICLAVKQLFNDDAARAEMERKAQAVVDGLGAQRVVDVMEAG